MRKRAPLRPSFTDTAKRAAGVHVRTIHDAELERDQARSELAQAREGYAKQLAGLVDMVRSAIEAYDQNRRGDALSILRSLVRSKTPGKLALPESEPPEPRRA